MYSKIIFMEFFSGAIYSSDRGGSTCLSFSIDDNITTQ